MVSKRSTEGTVERKERSSPFDIGKGGILLLVAMIALAAIAFTIFGGADVSLHGSESADASAGDGGSELNQPFTGDDDTEDVSEETEAVGYTGKYYPVDDIPSVLVLPDYVLKDRRYEGRGNLRVTNLRYEDGRFKFCVEDPTGRPYARLQIDIHDGNGNTVLDWFKTEIPRGVGEKVCLETRIMTRPIGAPQLKTVSIEIT